MAHGTKALRHYGTMARRYYIKKESKKNSKIRKISKVSCATYISDVVLTIIMMSEIGYVPALYQVVVAGHNNSHGEKLTNVELFPRPPSDDCSIPDLPQGRYGHSLSLLSGGRIVVCGGTYGSNNLDSCLSWVAGNTSWTDNYTMR